jgi:uncharacterized membrane protein
MEILILIVAAVVIIMFIGVRNDMKSGFMNLSFQITALRDAINENEKKRKEDRREAERQAMELSQLIAQMHAMPRMEEATPSPKPTEQFVQPVVIPIVEEEIKEEIAQEPMKIPNFIIVEEIKEEKIPEPEPVQEHVFEKIKYQVPIPPKPESKPYAAPEPQPSFFEKNPDIEKFIGENLINKIGIAILVLGIAFFVKYAIDEGWINEIGRVAIGILTGGLLIGIAHRLQKNFKAFSSVLIGGGLTVLYYTIGIAFHQYHIFSQEVAFAIMVVITSFAVVLTIIYNRIELAVLAIIGGFTTPFILSTGEGNYKVLFTYLLILNIGMLVLAFNKKWNLVNILCYLFTILIYGGWLSMQFHPGINGSYMGALFFASAFYLLFFLMNISYNIRNRMQFQSFEIALLLSNTALYYASGMYILHFYMEARYQGLFTVLMGIFNFGFAFALYKRKEVDKNLIFLLIGLVLTFISLAAPVQLEGHYITLFWAAESVLLLWFSQKSGIKLIKGTSVLVSILMLISLVMDWSKIYGFNMGSNELAFFFNKGFITSISCLISVVLSILLLKNESEDYFLISDFSVSLYKSILRVVFAVMLYFTFYLEFNNNLEHSYPDTFIRELGIGIYNFAFLIIGFVVLRKYLTRELALVFMILSDLCMLLFLVVYNKAIIEVRDEYLMANKDALFFYLHLLLVALYGFTIYIFNKTAKQVSGQHNLDWIKWLTVILTVYISSAELNHIILMFGYKPGVSISNTNEQVFKTGYSVLWGLVSFVLIRQGIKRKDRMLRIIALSLFALTIAKLFVWDLEGISEGGKIVAFILLGALLLVVSFMYQKLKILILQDKTHEEAEKNTSEN